MTQVIILQHRLLHYRLAFFNLLRQSCALRGINLCLVHGEATRREAIKKDEGSLPWAYKVQNRVWELGERDIIWQPFPAALREADLVIVMQENRILSNYPLLLRRKLGGPKVAYWGHGVNFQSNAPTGLREQWKRFTLTRVDWWFAYTELSANIVERNGYPRNRITCVNNAIDNEGFRSDLMAVTDSCIERLRADIGGSAIGLFCGSLYPDKKLDFMIAAAEHVRANLPDFRLIVIGDGPSAGEIRAVARSKPWIKYLGALRGQEKTPYFRLADVIFNPGAVGLHVLDAFYAGLPLATTLDAKHGPEIAYLKDGHNAIISSDNVEIYSQRVIRVLKDHSEHARLSLAATEAAKQYTLNNMVERFIDGIERCLQLPNHR
ncbi:glycosyltransferase family 4 protein [Nitrosospira multiformis]|uniref:Glycosyltransferase involved in cell wall bisynthesis n=1 Tax=Nitrosospira multiformis TaxID=1231 RepID=A0A1I7GBP8_9PROT|nr:glycosyltransferase family 4 protein [Nitrosospira multiformis]SFU45858.1 Glycosyltransferase involved in cell wall bisynthesis [Nitrosospira multiformis]